MTDRPELGEPGTVTRPDGSPCTCTWIPDEDGQPLPMGWALAHPELRVSRGRVSLSGVVRGVQYLDSDDGPLPVLILQPPTGPRQALIVDDIKSCTPLGGVYNESDMIYAIAKALGLLRSREEGTVTVRHLLNAHTALDIEVRHVSLTCRP